MSERLDNYSKILLATGQINYLANVINNTRQVHIAMSDQERIDKYEEKLKQLSDALTTIMENASEFINGCDSVEKIDIRIVDAAFDILVNGNDEIDK